MTEPPPCRLFRPRAVATTTTGVAPPGTNGIGTPNAVWRDSGWPGVLRSSPARARGLTDCNEVDGEHYPDDPARSADRPGTDGSSFPLSRVVRPSGRGRTLRPGRRAGRFRFCRPLHAG